MKEWSKARRDRNRKATQDYKVEQGCSDCGWNEHHAGLEFDHVAEKNTNVAMLMGNTKKLWAEIALCEVVCSRCHSLRTWYRINP